MERVTASAVARSAQDVALAPIDRARRLDERVEALAREVARRGRGRIAGTSPAWRETLRHAARVASSETTVLVTGESGTGKEVVAHLIHCGSSRAAGPFVAINCAALPEQLLESELFGHERGAFTGAVASHAGKIEQAAGGTLFLDEIGEMHPLVQAKLLRVLQERELQRLGGTRTLRADVRVVAATNRDLVSAIERGEFRQDLFYRLNVFEIHVAPLRERREDILPLAEAFLDELGRTMGRSAELSRDGRAGLLEHPWPGNVRELRNALERAILLADGGLITRSHLPAASVAGRFAMRRSLASGSTQPPPTSLTPDRELDLRAMDRGFVEKAFRAARGNKSEAARLLGLSRSQLYSRLERYGIR